MRSVPNGRREESPWLRFRRAVRRLLAELESESVSRAGPARGCCNVPPVEADRRTGPGSA